MVSPVLHHLSNHAPLNNHIQTMTLVSVCNGFEQFFFYELLKTPKKEVAISRLDGLRNYVSKLEYN